VFQIPKNGKKNSENSTLFFDFHILLKETCPGIPVIIYSAEPSAWWKEHMFMNGISACLCKCKDESILIQTIMQVAEGNNFNLGLTLLSDSLSKKSR
jgi:DNA-binding NarL/FixJ family response regulator